MVVEVACNVRRIPTALDRYPGKMVSHLAGRLVETYARDCTNLLDPFCGSGAILAAARQRGIPVTGIDINPYAVLLTRVKVEGFSPKRAREMCNALIDRAQATERPLPMDWDAKSYWFTPAVIGKYEALRSAARDVAVFRSGAGRAVLLAIALSVRLCSRADQRSPKPFISKYARLKRKGRHFDPYFCVDRVLVRLSEAYGRERLRGLPRTRVMQADIASRKPWRLPYEYSHVITSPPYINAQDYYRNFKLELHVLQGIMPFALERIRGCFIGTERGDLVQGVSERDRRLHWAISPELKLLADRSERHAAIVHRYLVDMMRSFDRIRSCLKPGATCVLVCGDNLVAGVHIRTWQILNDLLTQRGFELLKMFSDTIRNRMLPPKRMGHKGLIKEERVSVLRRI